MPKERPSIQGDSWDGYIYDFSSILELNLGPDETFIWDLDFLNLPWNNAFWPGLTPFGPLLW